MGLKSFLGVQYAKWVGRRNAWWIKNPILSQEKLFKHLISKGATTAFGKDHSFENIDLCDINEVAIKGKLFNGRIY